MIRGVIMKSTEKFRLDPDYKPAPLLFLTRESLLFLFNATDLAYITVLQSIEFPNTNCSSGYHK